MIPRSALAQALAVEANRNMLKQMDRILEEWNRRFPELAEKPPQPKQRPATKTTAKKK